MPYIWVGKMRWKYRIKEAIYMAWQALRGYPSLGSCPWRGQGSRGLVAEG